MPAKKTTKKAENEKEEKKFLEFDGYFGGLKLSGRVYPGEEKKGITRSFMYLNCNYGFTIQCHFVETKNNYFVAFPQYQQKDESYKSYVYIEKDSLWSEVLDKLAEKIYELLHEEDWRPSVDYAESGDLPF